MLTWTMVREMHKAGIGFGAHTVNHGILTRMSLKDAQREIVDSKARLDSEFNEPARHFAYPNGTGADWNPQIQSLVCQAGFRSACTTVPGLNRSGDDLYALRRLEVNDAGCTDPFGRFSPAMFRAHMVGLVGW